MCSRGVIKYLKNFPFLRSIYGLGCHVGGALGVGVKVDIACSAHSTLTGGHTQCVTPWEGGSIRSTSPPLTPARTHACLSQCTWSSLSAGGVQGDLGQPQTTQPPHTAPSTTTVLYCTPQYYTILHYTQVHCNQQKGWLNKLSVGRF